MHEVGDLKNSQVIEDFFFNIQEQVKQDHELALLLAQKLFLEDKTLFQGIKEGLLRHEDPDPTTWNDPGWFYGHVAIALLESNRCFLGREFTVPVLNVQISLGPEREVDGVPIVRLTWKKI